MAVRSRWISLHDFLKRLRRSRAGRGGEALGVPSPLPLLSQYCILLSQEKRIMLVAGRLLLSTTCPVSPPESEALTAPTYSGKEVKSTYGPSSLPD